MGFFCRRYLLSQHVVIIAGQSAESRFTQLKLIQNAGVDKTVDQSDLAIDIALTLARDHKVILCIPDLQNSRLPKLWSAGVRVLKDDAELPDLLQAASVKRAKMLITMRNAYAENIVLTRAALSPSVNNLLLECKSMIEPLAVKQKFRMEDYFEDDSLARVRIFNESELIARRMVRDHPPDTLVAETDRCVHVLLVGFNSIGQSIALQLARIGHYRNGQKPKITVVDNHIEDRWANAVESFPALPNWLQVELQELSMDDVKEIEAERWLKDNCNITMIYVSTTDEIANLRIARLLLRLLEKDTYKHLSQVQVVALDPPGGCVLEEFSKRDDNKNRFKLFSLTRAEKTGVGSPVAANLLTETDDEWARRLHQAYCNEQDQKEKHDPEHKRKPAHKPWELLAETYRQSNRSSADHIEVKLRAVGRTFTTQNQGVAKPLTNEEIELLARIEHNRWWADRALDGWQYSKNRDDALRLHPAVQPFDKLDGKDKKLDRENVENMLRIAGGKNSILTSVISS